MSTKLGFSVIELLVTVAIATSLLAVVVVNYGIANDNFAITSAVQEVAIATRQAQAYGLAVKESVASTGDFTYAYGIYFSMETSLDTISLLPKNTLYIVFVDRDNDNFYDEGTGSCGTITTECVEIFKLRNGVTITTIQNALGATPAGAASLNITFKRPNPDAAIYFKNGTGTTITGSPTTLGRVVLTSTRGNTATVVVESTGQILVQ